MKLRDDAGRNKDWKDKELEKYEEKAFKGNT